MRFAPGMSRFLSFLGGGILLLAVLIAPWWIAGVSAQAQFWLFAAVGIAGAAWLLSLPGNNRPAASRPFVIPLLLWPMAAYVGLGLFQLWPVATSPIATPPSASLHRLPWERPNVPEPSQSAAASESSPRHVLGAFNRASTLSPASTRFALARLAFASLAMFLSAQVFGDPRWTPWLWRGLALNGVALAFFGLVQMLTWNGKLFWTIPLELGGQPFSTFVNRNNAAGYLNICLAGGIALLAAPSIDPTSSDTDWDRPNWSPTIDPRTASIAAGLAIALIATGIVASASRGGALGLIGGLAAAGLLAVRRGGAMKLLAALAALVAVTVGLAAWTGAANRLWSRLDSPAAETIRDNGRWAHWKDALSVAADFPLTGTGLGTYRFASLPYQTHASDTRFVNADNQYVETLVEAGAFGLVCGLAGLALLAILVYRMSRTGTDLPLWGPALAGAAVVVSQGVCAFFDFGPVVTANMLLLAVVSGALCGQWSRSVPTSPGRSEGRSLSARSIGRITLVVLLFSAGGWGLREVHGVARLEEIRERVPALEGPDAIDDAALQRVLAELDGIPTDNPEVHQFAADLWAHRFRLAVFAQARRDEPQRAVTDLWASTQLPLLHRQANEWAADGQEERLAILEQDPDVRALLVPCVERLRRAVACCPFYPRSDLMQAALAFVRSPRAPAGLDEIHRGLWIAPTLEQPLLTAAELFDSCGETELARACWKRCLSFYPLAIPNVHRRVAGAIKFDDELSQILPDSPRLLLTFARETFADESHSSERNAVGRKVLELLAQSGVSETFPEAEQHRLRGEAWELRGDWDESILSLQQAISLAPLEADTRLELARVLRKMGRHSEARKQASIAVSLRPRDVDARRLFDELQKLENRAPSSEPVP